MTRDAAVELIRAHRDELQQFDVKTLSLFGSVARNEATAESDLDVLVEFGSAPTFDGYMGLKIFLEDLFGVRVDLATPKSLHPGIERNVRRDAVLVV